LCTDDIADTISAKGVFMHGPTFMGNPLACALAGRSLELLEENAWQQQIASIEATLKETLLAASELPAVKEARVLGAIGVLEMHEPVDMAEAQKFFVSRGVWLRPFGRLVYIMPPYITSADELRKLTSAMLEFAAGLKSG
jgi:adenosylmethionine-8-amino-7-oxononanoate aminotransferase